MSFDTSTSSWRTVTDRVALLSRDDRFWVTVAVVTGLWIHLAYLASHEYPAFGGGLYLAIAEQIVAHGYGLPATIAGYTAGGVPFGYPPLMFYVAAVVRDLTGIDPFAYSQLLPGLIVTAYLVPYYFTAKELLGSPRVAGFATVLFATTPTALRWHISAGGTVRAAAVLFALSGAYVGVRLFRDDGRRWLAAAVALFGLTVLTHPTYTIFFGLTYLLLYARFDRSLRGLAAGIGVAAGGLLLAAPWWLSVIATHGVDIFIAAAGTHGGLGGGLGRIEAEFIAPLDWNVEVAFFLAAYAGGFYALIRRRWLLPAWVFVSGYVIGKPRFLFVAGSMLTALLVFEVVLPAARAAVAGYGATDRGVTDSHRRRTLPFAIAVVLAVSSVGVGTLFVAGALDVHHGSPSQPAFVDDADVAAMAWVEENTRPTADFVVLGDAAEWFPLLTDRTILIGPWGVEWTSPDRYYHQLALFKRISTCGDAACVTEHLRANDIDPAYLYVTKDTYTVRGVRHHRADRMRPSLIDAPQYELVFANRGVMIFRIDNDGSPSAREPVESSI